MNLTAVGGSFFNSIADTSWALWSTNQPAAMLHLHFSVFENSPRQAIVTPGKCSEPDALRTMIVSRVVTDHHKVEIKPTPRIVMVSTVNDSGKANRTLPRDEPTGCTRRDHCAGLSLSLDIGR